MSAPTKLDPLRYGLAGLAGILVGCCAAADPPSAPSDLTPPPIGRQSHAITDGSPSPLDVAVALVTPDGRAFCSGTLVARRRVLTAAHCVVGSAVELVSIGEHSAPPATLLPVVDVVAHPDYDEGTLEADVAMVALAEDAPVPPLSWPPPTGADVTVGDELLVVGFGRSEPADASSTGTRLQRPAAVTAIGPGELELEGVTCGGDSGGPVLRVGEGVADVVGVTSSGTPTCRRLSRAVRVAAYVAWIDEAIATMHAESTPGAGCAVAGPGRARGASSFILALALVAVVVRTRR